ncbi:MAG: hypothetical protein ACLFR2_01135 [Candidatus Kapaibacterium sp.]
MAKTVKKSKTAQAPPKKTKGFPSWAAYLIFLLTTAIFFWDVIAGNSFFWEDFAEYVYPVQTFAARESADWSLPFWNPYTFGGMPFMADIQTGFFYPLNRVFTLFVSPEGELPVSIMQLVLILHFFIAQASMFLLARHFRISVTGSIISSISFGFSGILVHHVIHPMIIHHLAWFPLILMLFHKGLQERKLRPAVGAGALLGMSMMSGHPQMTLYEGLFLGLFLIWHLITSIIGSDFFSRRPVKYIFAGLLPFALAIGIFAIQFLPSQQLAGLSQRAEISYENASKGSLEPEQILTAFVPKIFGYVGAQGGQTVQYYLNITKPGGQTEQAPYFYYWETSFYFGIAALILGLFGFMSHWRNYFVGFLIFFVIFAFLFALGSNAFLLGIFFELPFFGTFRIPSRMLFGLILAFSFMAGIGFDKLGGSKGKKSFILLIVAIAIPFLAAFLTATGAVAGMINTPAESIDAVNGFGVNTLIITIIAGAILAAVFHQKLNKMIGGILLAILLFADLAIAGSSFNEAKISPQKQFALDSRLESVLKPNLPEDIFRVNSRIYQPVQYMAMKRNQGMVSQIMLKEGYNPLILERVNPPVRGDIHPNDIFNVKYEIAIDSVSGRPYFAENTDMFPRAWMVDKYEVYPEDEIREAMENNYFNLRETVILEKEPEAQYEKEPLSGKIKCTRYEINHQIYEINTDKNVIIVFSEIWYPNWKVYVDGTERELLRANYSLRAVEVPEGIHKIEMRYDSSEFFNGFVINLITVLAAIAIFLISDREKMTLEKYYEDQK